MKNMTSCWLSCVLCHVSASQGMKAQMSPMFLSCVFRWGSQKKTIFDRKCSPYDHSMATQEVRIFWMHFGMFWEKTPQLVQTCKCVYWWCPKHEGKEKCLVGIMNKRDEIPHFISFHRIIHKESLVYKNRNNENKQMTFSKLNLEQMLAISWVWLLKQIFSLWNHLYSKWWSFFTNT